MSHTPRTIQNVFVLLLLSLFACLSTFLVTMGAQLYRSSVESADRNNNSRIMTAVVRSAIWAEDGGRVVIENFDDLGITALTIIEEDDEEGEVYYKRLYAYEGYLQECYSSGEFEFHPDYGEPLCELSRFEPAINGKVLTVDLETTDHIPASIRMTLRAGGAEQ